MLTPKSFVFRGATGDLMQFRGTWNRITSANQKGASENAPSLRYFLCGWHLPRAAGSPPAVLCHLRPVPGMALLSAAPAGDLGRHFAAPFPPLWAYYPAVQLHEQALRIAADGAFAPPALPQPAALRISLHPHRTAFRSQCTRLRLVRLFSGHPTSTVGSHNGFCDKPCIAHRNQPLPFLLISL